MTNHQPLSPIVSAFSARSLRLLSFIALESNYAIARQSTRVTQIIISSRLRFEIMHHLPLNGCREAVDVHIHQAGKPAAFELFTTRREACAFIEAFTAAQKATN